MKQKQDFVNVRIRREDWEKLRLMSEIFGCHLWKAFGHVVSLALSAISGAKASAEGLSLNSDTKTHWKPNKRNREAS